MLQAGCELDLAQEPLGAQRARELGVEHLEGHRAVVLEIAGEVDGGHAAAAELALDAVAVTERVGERAGASATAASMGESEMCPLGAGLASARLQRRDPGAAGSVKRLLVAVPSADIARRPLPLFRSVHISQPIDREPSTIREAPPLRTAGRLGPRERSHSVD